AGPHQVAAVVDQLGRWGADGGWFASFAAAGPEALHDRLTQAAAGADAAIAELRTWLADAYAPAAASAPDAAGRDRYRLRARAWSGADLDLDEAYAWAWTEFARLDAEIRAEAGKVLRGATPAEA